MTAICHLDGVFLPLSQARVSPMDRGFLFGDGGYEVIPAYSRRPFRLDEHLLRLQTTLAALQIGNPHSLDEWRALILGLIERNSWQDQSIYLQVSRGTDTRRNHAFPVGVAPTVFVMSEELVTVPEAQRLAGVGAVSAQAACEARTAATLAVGTLGVLFVARGYLYSVDAPDWTVWLTPQGWMQEPAPSTAHDWWPLLLGVALTVVLLVVAFALQARRDFGQGSMPPQRGPARGAGRYRRVGGRRHRGGVLFSGRCRPVRAG